MDSASGDSDVFPAHAGMNREWRKASGRMWVFPAHAGMNRSSSPVEADQGGVPRARGDEPESADACSGASRRVPRARGDEPQIQCFPYPSAVVFPAHAGMNRSDRISVCLPRSVPRARGDEPVVYVPASADAQCSPRTRG